MAGSLLSVEHLTLHAPQGMILEDLSFEVHPGEIVALTGRSGSGKTSVALAILQLLPPEVRMETGIIRWSPDTGESLTLPGDTAKWPPLRGTYIGYTQQDAFGAFDPVMRMGDQMMLIIQERSDSLSRDPARDLRMKMEEVGLHDLDRLWTSYPHQLSGGQLQRCQIAMSIVIEPKLLISDEPTSAIDKINQVELLDVFSMLRTRYNMAILCITHEEAVVRHLADREVEIGEVTREHQLSVPARLPETKNPEKPLIEAKSLTYRHRYGGMAYKAGATIGPLDFSLYPGHCLGIVGESGSGKSTLAQLLVGLFAPVSGHLHFQDRLLDYGVQHDLQLLRSKVQLVMQDGRGSLHPHLTVRRLLREVMPEGRNMEKRADEDIESKLAEVGLPAAILDRKAPQLSGGECLRVCIARALLMHPVLLICDESTSSLDGATRDAIVAMLRDLMQRHGMALIFISHDERIIRDLAHEVLVLSAGQVVEKGPAAEVILYPTHPVSKKIFTTHATLAARKRP